MKVLKNASKKHNLWKFYINKVKHNLYFKKNNSFGYIFFKSFLAMI